MAKHNSNKNTNTVTNTATQAASPAAPATPVQAPAVPATTAPSLTSVGAQLAALLASQPQGTGLRNPRSNGVRVPAAGGKCHAVWAQCTAMVAAGQVPTPKALVAWAQANGQNVSNAQQELYAWRRANGISGRVAAPLPAPVVAADSTQA